MPASTTSTRAVIDLHLDDVHVVTHGGRRPEYKEEDGQRVMKQSEITVRVGLDRGSAQATVWTCDSQPRLHDDQRRLPVLSVRAVLAPVLRLQGAWDPERS